MRNKLLLTVFLLAATAVNARHYKIGYNFEVCADTLHAQENDPIVAIDTLDDVCLTRGQTLVVARLQYVPTDSAVWVQVGTLVPGDSIVENEHAELLWVREHELLRSTVPDKIVTKTIRAISLRTYTWQVMTLGLLVFLFLARYLQRNPEEGGVRKESIQIMLLDKIPSPYPWLLAASVAASTLAIRLTDTTEWTSFYFSPTLNPLVPESAWVSASLSLLWFTLIVLIATVSEIFRLLPLRRALAYVASVPSVCTFVVWLLTRF